MEFSAVIQILWILSFVWVAVDVAKKKWSPTAKIFWIVLVAIMGIIGLVVYHYLGRRDH